LSLTSRRANDLCTSDTNDIYDSAAAEGEYIDEVSLARLWQFNEQGTSIMTNRFGLSRADGHWAVQGRGQCYKCTVEKKRHEPLRDLSIDTISSTRARTWPRQDRFVSRGLKRGRDGWAGPRNLLVITHTIPRLSLSLFLSCRCGQVTRIDGIVPRQSWCIFSEWNVDRFMEDCDPLGFRMINKTRERTYITRVTDSITLIAMNSDW